MGVTLFVHVTSFIGVSYFGQIQLLIWLSLAIAGSLCVNVRAGRLRSGQSFADDKTAQDLPQTPQTAEIH
jgi:hypothetical protein